MDRTLLYVFNIILRFLLFLHASAIGNIAYANINRLNFFICLLYLAFFWNCSNTATAFWMLSSRATFLPRYGTLFA